MVLLDKVVMTSLVDIVLLEILDPCMHILDEYFVLICKGVPICMDVQINWCLLSTV